MANNNQLLTDDIILKETLMRFKNTMVVGKTCNRWYEDKFNNYTGRTIRIPNPVYYEHYDTAEIPGVLPIIENWSELTIDQRRVIPVGITSEQRALELSSFSELVSGPIAEQLANLVDLSIIQQGVDNVYNWVGSPDTAVNSFSIVNDANTKLNKFGVRASERYLVLSPNDYNALTTAEKGQNNFYEALNKTITEDAKITVGMRRYSNFDTYWNQNILTHTVGNYTGTPVIKGAGQSGATLLVDGFTGSAGTTVLKKGDRFTIAGVNAVNPVGLNDIGDEAQFIITADVTIDGSGNATIPISPSITLTGAYRNVTNAPADNAPLTILGDPGQKYTVNYAYQKQAVTLAVVPLPRITSVNGGALMKDKDLGLSMRMTPYYDGPNDQENYRFDVMFGVKWFALPYAVAVISQAS